LDQKIASKLAPTKPLKSITYFMFDKRGHPVFDAALSRSKQDSEYLQHPPIGSLSFGRGVVRGLLDQDQKIARQARSYRAFRINHLFYV
ncbi:hypothetical protein, partial [Pseudomonas helleri]|uniref:hypothetical protein n=1 Tax=Pseudomonas helleri TaxID=1608996 RepID=UPI003F99930A